MAFNESVGYLLHELSQRIDSESDQILRERFGIGFAQYKVLLAVDAQKGISQKKIAFDLAQTEASISRQVGILIDKDFIYIGPAKDNRKHPIYLTSRGEEVVIKATSALNDHHRHIFRNLSEKQQVSLVECLQNIQRQLG